MGPGGHCPRCLLEAGLEGDSLSVGGGGAVGVTMALESTGPAGGVGVLAALASSVGAVPRVLLRDTDSGPEPPARPGSDAMPALADRSGRLQLHGEIARGGMGAVLKGRDADLGRDLAVKVLLERHRNDPELVRRFVEEAQIAGQLQHPGIVPVYELGAFADRRPYFAMKLVKGRTLAEILRDRPGPAHDLPRLLATFLQVAQTVAYAHARGVIHRDLKPSNVMVGSFGEVQVMDWGLAKVLPRGGAVDDATAGRTDAHETLIATARSGGGDRDLSRAGSVLGTPAYMAPEQARGEVDRLDERCDVFALGSILCEVLTGAPAFSGRSSGEIQRQATRGGTADAIARLEASGADPELLGLARDCLAAEVEDRPRDAGAVAERLSAHLSGVQERLRAAELAAAAAAARAAAERRARRLTAALAASVIGLIALGAGGYAWALGQWAERAARTAAAVDAALAEAARLAGEARAAPEGAAAKWAEAIAQARRSEDLVQQGEADDPTRRRVAQAIAQVIRERDEAEERARRAAADRRLLDRLAAIRGGGHDHLSLSVDRQSQANSGYAEAFRAAGLDPDARPDEFGAAIRSRPAAVALGMATALDHWADLRRDWLGDHAGAARLSAAACAADPDPWRCDLRKALGLSDDAPRLAELRRLAASARLDELGPVSLDLLGYALQRAGDLPGAETILRAAQRRHPGDVWVNLDLADVLVQRGRRPEALRFYYVARAVRPDEGFYLVEALKDNREPDEAVALLRDLARLRPEEYLPFLGQTLKSLGRQAEADTVLEAAVAHARELVQKQPADPVAQVHLGYALDNQGKNAEAEAAFREALRLKPDSETAHGWLGSALMDKNPPEAETHWRQAIRSAPGAPGGHNGLSIALERQDKYREAEVAIREAVRLEPSAFFRGNLGRVLLAAGKLTEAEAAYREAAQVDPINWSHFVALSLERQRRFPEAEAAYREAIRVGDRFLRPLSYLYLARTLTAQGRLEEAVETLRQASAPRESGSRRAVIARELGRAERRLALAPRLPAVLRGDDRPADARDGLELARLSLDTGRPAAAARLFAAALEADPALAEDLEAVSRYENPPRVDAARAAALAGCGNGRDDPPPDAHARARLRRQALDGFRAEFAAWTKGMDSSDDSSRRMVLAALRRWQYTVSDLDNVRAAEGLAELPEAERADWRALWAESEALLKRLWSAPR
jgi:serine/threonine-protein kinase